MVRAALRGGRSEFPATARISMADNARDRGNPGDRPPDGAALSARLQRLGQRIGETEAHRHPPAVQNASDPSALARGFRLSSELVAGVLVGAGIGWLLDRWLGISPWGDRKSVV